MTISEALNSNRDKINFTSLAKELGVSRYIFYRYINNERQLSGFSRFSLAVYLYFKHGIETEEFEEYKHLFKNI